MKKLIVRKSSLKEEYIQFGISDKKYVYTGLEVTEKYPIKDIKQHTITFDISNEEFNQLKGKEFGLDKSQSLVRLIIERTYPELLL